MYAAVGQLSAELCALRGQLEEANRTKAVLANKLQAARGDNAALLGRMQASPAWTCAAVQTLGRGAACV